MLLHFHSTLMLMKWIETIEVSGGLHWDKHYNGFKSKNKNHSFVQKYSEYFL